jgi:hypothetical protein
MDHERWKTAAEPDRKIEVQKGMGNTHQVTLGYYDEAGFQGQILATIEPDRFLKGDNAKAFNKWLDWVVKNSGKVKP